MMTNSTSIALHRLKTDSELQRLILPYDQDEDEFILQYVMNDNIPIIYVWQGYIYQDYALYDFCHSNKIPFQLSELNHNFKEEIILDLCNDQLKRSDLTPEMRKYLIGKISVTELNLNLKKATVQGPPDQSDLISNFQNDQIESGKMQIRFRLCNHYFVSSSTVRKYENYCNMIDQLYYICPLLAQNILYSKVKIGYEQFEQLLQKSSNEIIEITDLILHNENSKYKDSRELIKSILTMYRHGPTANTNSIKDLPSYDPDSSLLSLMFTVPTWVSSIARFHSTCNIKDASQSARVNLLRELLNLRNITDDLIKDIQKEASSWNLQL